MMDNEKIIRKKVFVYGAVQGVGFRYRAEHAATMVLIPTVILPRRISLHRLNQTCDHPR